MRFTAEPPAEATNVSYVAAAPDGRFMVYQAQVEGDARIFVRRFDDLESRLLAGAEGLMQYFDRDTSEDLATVAMKGFQEFMIDPDRLDAVLESIERARKRIYKAT